jgi:Glycosyltransferase family 87
VWARVLLSGWTRTGQTRETPAARGALALAGALQVLGWTWYAAGVWRQEGLFSRIGLDFGFFWATARAYVLDGPLALFDLDAIARAGRPLVAYYASPAGSSLNVAPPVYPPVFFALLAPLTGLPPLLGLALWTFAGVVAATAALTGVWRVAVSDRPMPAELFAATLSFGPLALGLILGQVEALLVFALYRVYRALRQGDDFSAGLWLGPLLLKPQYAVFLALVFVLKRRWRAVIGLALVASLVAILSLAVIGANGVGAFGHQLADAAAFRPPPEAAAHAPGDMISWRGLLYTLWPAATQQEGMALTLALSALTVAVLPLVWWGPWQPAGDRFSRRMLATMLVTMLASFHNHFHGATLVLVPAVAAMAEAAQPDGRRPQHLLLLPGLFLPSAVFWLSGDLALTAQMVGALLIAGLLVIGCAEAQDAWHARTRAKQQAPATSGSSRPPAPRTRLVSPAAIAVMVERGTWSGKRGA